MNLLRILRLLVALLGLGFSMAGPAAAATNMASRPASLDAMPCHETATSTPDKAVASRAAQADPAFPHLCCVISQLVAPPLVMPALRHPEASALMLQSGPERSTTGREPAIPVPPPRPA